METLNSFFRVTPFLIVILKIYFIVKLKIIAENFEKEISLKNYKFTDAPILTIPGGPTSCGSCL